MARKLGRCWRCRPFPWQERNFGEKLTMQNRFYYFREASDVR